MSQNSPIEWTDATWNPIRGCSRVSEGCVNCYAEGIAARFSGPGQPYEGLAKRMGKEPRWTGKVSFIEGALTAPLHWKSPKKIFVNSMSDLFHEKVPDEWIDRIFAVMALCPQHTFQILTKRADRMRAYVSAVPEGEENRGWLPGAGPMIRVDHAIRGPLFDKLVDEEFKLIEDQWSICSDGIDGRHWPLANVWLGVSVEDQATADERIPLLLQTPAAIRFVSYEPALGPVDFTNIGGGEVTEAGGQIKMQAHGTDVLTPYNRILRPQLDWIICGGESGNKARPMNPQWARDVRDQCAAASVAFFFKQNGEWVSVSEVEGPGEHYSFPDHRTVRRTGKKRSGRTLDGIEHNAFPETDTAKAEAA